jgi:hypothetical protein
MIARAGEREGDGRLVTPGLRAMSNLDPMLMPFRPCARTPLRFWYEAYLARVGGLVGGCALSLSLSLSRSRSVIPPRLGILFIGGGTGTYAVGPTHTCSCCAMAIVGDAINETSRVSRVL